MDVSGLLVARDQATAALPCLQEPIGLSDAAAFHRMNALVAFTAQNKGWALAEFHAARRLEPGYVIPREVAPSGHRLVRLYEDALSADEGEPEAVNPPLGGHVAVDGVPGAPRPGDISAVLQVFDADDTLTETVYLLPGDELPSWGPPPVTLADQVRLPLSITGGAALLASGAFTALALRNAELHATEMESLEDLATYRQRTNSFTWAALGAGGAGLVLGTTVALTW